MSKTSGGLGWYPGLARIVFDPAPEIVRMAPGKASTVFTANFRENFIHFLWGGACNLIKLATVKHFFINFRCSKSINACTERL